MSAKLSAADRSSPGYAPASNPWLQPLASGEPSALITPAAAQIAQIRASEDLGWLRRVLLWPDNPVSVLLAADARLKKLKRQQRKAQVGV